MSRDLAQNFPPAPAAPGITRRDLGLLALIGVFPLALFSAVALSGQSYFWGDLTYIHHGWRCLPAEQLQRGVLPLWNPYAYLGMPLAGELQSAVWYPGSLPFYFFPFAAAVPLFLLMHFWLAGAFAFLWLRRRGFSRAAAAAAGVAWMLGGLLASRIPFLNHVSTLAYFPALLLFAARPALLGACLALSFLSGYPTMLAGAAAAAAAVSFALCLGRGAKARPAARGAASAWLKAGLLSAALGACLLVPGAELARDSRRGEGVAREEGLSWSFAPRDLVQLTAPPLIPSAEFSPAGAWWKTAYLGWGACLAAVLGLIRLGPLGAAAALAYLAGVLVILLGGSNPVSLWLWTHFWPLRFVRYPGNMAYLLLPLVAVLVAAGLHRRRWGRPAALLLGAELLVLAAWGQPLVPADYFTDAGPLVPVLRRELAGKDGGHRYLISPSALQAHRGFGADRIAASRDLKHRLYGLTNLPYRLPAVANFGEPLVPSASYAFMDFLYTRAGLEELAPWLAWADARVVMTRERRPSGKLEYLGDSLWQLYRFPGELSRAYWLDERSGENLPAGLDSPPPDSSRALPVRLRRSREDRFELAGRSPSPGWLFVSEPRWPGWSVRVNGEAAPHEPALRAFFKLRVPAGDWSVRFRYDPPSWRSGRGLTLLVLCALAAYWYNRLRSRASSVRRL